MKILITVFLMMGPFILTGPALARDFFVEFVEENYRETEMPYSNDPQIYHSVQVNSHAGPKLLILTGDDQTYRKWLRQYIAADKKFIARIPDDDNDRFIAAKAYELDVTSLHPFSSDTMVMPKRKKGDAQVISNIVGNRHILLVDTNDKRIQLVSDVIRQAGYTATISRDGNQALEMFQVQPEKFKMIIANHKAPGVNDDEFLTQLLKIDHQIPILVETGYRNLKTKQRFQSKFSGAGSIVLTPMVLKDLGKTIKQLIKADPARKTPTPPSAQMNRNA